MDIETSVEVKQLQAILAKAEKNGFEFKTGSSYKDVNYLGFGRFSLLIVNDDQESEFIFHVNELFFNHKFSQTFFGDYEICTNCLNKLKKIDWDQETCLKCNSNLSLKNSYMESWQYRLQKMVLENNILKFLFDNL